MRKGQFFDLLTEEDDQLVGDILGVYRKPDLVIAPDGAPYLVRWEIVKSSAANVYLHLQVASDPERPLHDHPWDNTSVILSGGYHERLLARTPFDHADAERAHLFTRLRGDVIYRRADWPHRLFLPRELKYTLSLFSTGPKIRDWGFWTSKGWVSHTELIETVEDRSIHKKGARND